MKKYQIIYADPPWHFHAWSSKGMGRCPEIHYPTMDLDEIKSLPIVELADKNCALFLWATYPMLQAALDVINAWGFTYKTTAFVWVKVNRKTDSLFTGMGYWTRANSEVCLLATRGSPKRHARAVHQVILSRIEEHSKKPDVARQRIEELMGDVPRVELFARQHAPGWDVWGNEVASSFRMEHYLNAK